ncbi:uncharacterized protein [Temnothorax nylanderi]|uniref:uncharacterized protein isoform X2 n=1 Tax=Temnothorax nylanderi TaxID=102681 RepID=UPI003A83BFE0
MESEARNQINNNYNKFFYATMCHVCKRFDDGVELKRCRGCKMILYCGKEHQKQHWKQHKPLCKAIQDVLRDHIMDYCGETAEKWAGKKLTFAQLVSSRLGRPLHIDETDMFYFRKECLVCHEWKTLRSCLKCAASFCQIHKNDIEHYKICLELGLCFRTNLLSIKKKYSSPYLHSYLQRVSYTSHTFRNMKQFIKAFGNVPTGSEMPYQVLEAEHSEYLTRPLTLFYAMRSLIYDNKERKNLVIHVVGASHAEKATLIGWEVLPRLLELLETAMSITIVMIGPKLKYKCNSNACDPCTSSDIDCLLFKYHHVLQGLTWIFTSMNLDPRGKRGRRPLS